MPKETVEDARLRMTKELHDAVYPILIPVEQQDMAIHARNSAVIYAIALFIIDEFTRRMKNEQP